MAQCPEVATIPRDVSVSLPGGVRLQVQYPGDPPSSLALLQQLMGQAGSAMAPLSPIFSIIKAVGGLIDFSKAAVTLDIPTMTEALATVLESATEIAGLVPPLSIPSTVASFVDVLILYLEAVVSALQEIVTEQERIAAAQATLDGLEGGNSALEESIACANTLLSGRIDDLEESLSSAGGFIDLINSLMSLIGLNPVPDLDDLGSDASAAIEGLQRTIVVVRGVRSAIPL